MRSLAIVMYLFRPPTPLSVTPLIRHNASVLDSIRGTCVDITRPLLRLASRSQVAIAGSQVTDRLGGTHPGTPPRTPFPDRERTSPGFYTAKVDTLA